MRVRQQQFLLVMIICSYAIFIMLGLRYSFGLYLIPVVGSTHAIDLYQFGNALAYQNLVWGIASLFIGAFYHRVSRVFLLLLGGVCAVIGLLLFSHIVYAWELYLGLILFGIGVATGGMIVSLEFVSAFAPIGQKTYYTSIALALGSLSYILMPLLVYCGIWLQGWRMNVLTMATLPLILCFSLIFLRHARVQTRQRQQNLLPYIDGLKCKGYCYLTLGFFVCGFHVGFIAAYFPVYLHSYNMPDWLVSASLPLIGMFNFIGILSMGYLSKKWLQKNLLSTIYGLRALVLIAMLLLQKTVILFMVVACLLGYLWLATVPLTNGLVRTFFSQDNLARFYSPTFFFHQLGAFAGVWLGAMLFNLLGHYNAFWWIDVALSILAMFLHMIIKEKRHVRKALLT